MGEKESIPSFPYFLREVKKRFEKLSDDNKLKEPAVLFFESLAKGTPIKKISTDLRECYEKEDRFPNRAKALYEELNIKFRAVMNDLPPSFDEFVELLHVNHDTLVAESYKLRIKKLQETKREERNVRMAQAVDDLMQFYDRKVAGLPEGTSFQLSQKLLEEENPDLFRDLNKAAQAYRSDGARGWQVVFETLRALSRYDILDAWDAEPGVITQLVIFAKNLDSLYVQLSIVAGSTPVELGPSDISKCFSRPEYRRILRLIRQPNGTLNWDKLLQFCKQGTKTAWKPFEKVTDSAEYKEEERKKLVKRLVEQLQVKFPDLYTSATPILYAQLNENDAVGNIMRSIYEIFLVNASFSFELFRRYLPPKLQTKILPPRS